MKLVDDVGLPEAILRALERDPYNKGNADISVTGLLKPPFLRSLEAFYEPVIEEEASDRIYALLGKAVHAILEMAELTDRAKYLREERFFTEQEGWRISGQCDLIDLEARTLHDFKVCSRWVGIFGAKDEWEQQLNLYRLLARRNGVEVNTLKVHAIYRDWSKREAKSKRDYPQKQIETFDLPVWSYDQAEQFLAERVHLHKVMDDNLRTHPEEEWLRFVCNAEERWDRGNKYAVKHRNKDRAIKLFDDRPAAESWKAANQRPGENLVVEFRNGESIRCASYCIVRHLCPFGRTVKDDG